MVHCAQARQSVRGRDGDLDVQIEAGHAVVHLRRDELVEAGEERPYPDEDEPALGKEDDTDGIEARDDDTGDEHGGDQGSGYYPSTSGSRASRSRAGRAYR